MDINERELHRALQNKFNNSYTKITLEVGNANLETTHIYILVNGTDAHTPIYAERSFCDGKVCVCLKLYNPFSPRLDAINKYVEEMFNFVNEYLKEAA